MSDLPGTLLIPGLLCTPSLYGPQLASLWRLAPVTIANHTQDDSVSKIAQRILSAAPARFALVGLSMGGYLSFEIMRQAPERVVKLVLMDTSARPDTAEASASRRAQIELARAGRFDEMLDPLFSRLLHPTNRMDAGLRGILTAMAQDVGVEAFARQQHAIMARPDSRRTLGTIRCPTLVIVGDRDELTPPERAAEIAAGIEGAQLVTVPNAGHVTTLERPDFVTRALVEFLEAPAGR